MNSTLRTVIARLDALDNERGQGTLEYVGMIIVAAILAVAVLTAVGSIDLGSVFSSAISKVTDFG